VTVWECNGGGNQQWTYDSEQQLKGEQSGNCLSVLSNNPHEGALVVIEECDDRTGEIWIQTSAARRPLGQR
jgi:alpha-galactosidase